MGKDKHWRVFLGDEHWTRYTYAREPGAALRLLGSIARGPQVGALGLTADGRYVQVNGDHVTPLGTSQVRQAVAAAQAAETRMRPRSWRPAPSTPVVVTVKRRRVPVIARSMANDAA
jgi:hypothetical protein